MTRAPHNPDVFRQILRAAAVLPLVGTLLAAPNEAPSDVLEQCGA